jgi:hypothetical protein
MIHKENAENYAVETFAIRTLLKTLLGRLNRGRRSMKKRAETRCLIQKQDVWYRILGWAWTATLYSHKTCNTLRKHNALHNWRLLEYSVFRIWIGGVRMRSKITPFTTPTSQRTSLGVRTVLGRTEDLKDLREIQLHIMYWFHWLRTREWQAIVMAVVNKLVMCLF